MFLLIGMVGFVAFALDLGYIYTARTELQRSADAAALAATWRLLEDQIVTLGEISRPDATVNARAVAEQFARLNVVSRVNPELAENDVAVGTLCGQRRIGSRRSRTRSLHEYGSRPRPADGRTERTNSVVLCPGPWRQPVGSGL